MIRENSTPASTLELEPPSSEPLVASASNVGFLGKSVAATLGGIGSNLIMPVSKRNRRHYEHVKELKVTGHTSTSIIMQTNPGCSGTPT